MNNDKFLDGVISGNACEFMQCWVGPCNKIDCNKHKDLKCRCGSKAIHDCGETHGPMVCGSNLCKTCACGCRGMVKWD